MTTINTVGRITKDLELKTFESTGDKYVNFGLAVNQGFGEKQKPVFYECSIYGKDAERIVKAGAKKGSAININGLFEVSEYQRQDGSGTGYKLKIKVLAWSYVPGNGSNKNSDTPNGESRPDGGNAVNTQNTPEFPPNNHESFNLDDDDLPF